MKEHPTARPADPLGTAAPDAATVSLSSFGARGDGRTDDAAAWADALVHCAHHPGTILTVPAGRYRIAGPGAAVMHERYHLAAAGLDGVTIAGEEGAEIVFADPERGGIHWRSCRKVTVRGLSFDWDPAPWTTGTIRATGQDGFILDPDPGAPAPTPPLYRPEGRDPLLGYLLLADRSGLFSAPLPNNHRDPAAIEAVGDGGWRIRLRSGQTMAGTAPGQGYLLLRRSATNPALTWRECSDSALIGVAIHASPSIGIRLDPGCSGMRIEGCRIEPRPGSILSTNADGIMVIGNRSGPAITGNQLIGVMDEGISVYVYGRLVRGIDPEGGGAVVERYFGADLAIGDRIEVLTADRRRIIAGLRVGSLDGAPPIQAGSRSIVCDRLTVAGGDHVLAEGDLVFSAEAVNRGLRIAGNRIARIRGKGIKISGASGAVVEDNCISDTSGAGIEAGFHVAKHQHKYEAMRWVDDLTVSGNRIEGSGLYGLPFSSIDTARKGQVPALRIDVSLSEGGPAAGINRDIRVLCNQVRRCAQTGIQIDNAAGVRAVGNQVSEWNRYGHADEAGLHLRGCSGVELEGNRFEDGGSGAEVIDRP